MTAANTDGALTSRVSLMFMVSCSAIALKCLIIGDRGPPTFPLRQTRRAVDREALLTSRRHCPEPLTHIISLNPLGNFGEPFSFPSAFCQRGHGAGKVK